eukprot:jgi/Tetstr1/433587/TSEL_022853.t1
MGRLYAWSPDEAIPEFYTDAAVFRSIHPDMPDLAVPPWAAGPEDFVERHRAALESEWVSSQLHHWVDLQFGWKMSGPAAVAAKNVVLSSQAAAAGLGPQPLRGAHPGQGRFQIFRAPHPPRAAAPASADPAALRQLEDGVRFGCLAGGAAPGGAWAAAADSRVAIWEGQADDVAGVGAVAAQLLSGQLLLPGAEEGGPAAAASRLLPSLPIAAQPLVAACLASDPAARPSVRLLLASSLFSPRLRGAARLLAELRRRGSCCVVGGGPAAVLDPGRDLCALGSIAAEGLLDTASEEGALPLCAPQLAALLVAAAPITDARVAACGAEVARSMAELLSPAEVERHLLPALEAAAGAASPAVLAGLLSPGLHEALIGTLGTPRYLDTGLPWLLEAACRNEDGGGQEALASAAAALGSLATRLPLPLLLQALLRPLMASLGHCRGLAGPMLAVAAALPEAFLTPAILSPLLASLQAATRAGDSGAPAARQPPTSPSNGATTGTIAAGNAIAAIAGLIGRLPPQVLLECLLGAAPSPAPASPDGQEGDASSGGGSGGGGSSGAPSTGAADAGTGCVLLGLLLSPPPALHRQALALEQAAGALVHAVQAADREGQCALAALLPALNRLLCLPRHLRAAYGVRGDGGQEDSGYWAVVHVLYPGMAQVVGLQVLRASVSQWAMLEHSLRQRFDWVPALGARRRTDSPQRAPKVPASYSAPQATSQELQALLLEDVGWSVPFQHQAPAAAPAPTAGPDAASLPLSSQQPLVSPGRSAGSAHRQPKAAPPRLPGVISGGGGGGDGGSLDRGWRWLLPSGDSDGVTWPGFEPAAAPGSGRGGWRPPWAMSLTPLHAWPAHRDKLRTLAVDDDEWVVVTSGRGTVGGQATEVCRAWGLADCQAGVQYRSHAAPVSRLALLPGSEAVVASLDTGGALHLWSALSGRPLAVVSDSSRSISARAAATSVPVRRIGSADQVSGNVAAPLEDGAPGGEGISRPAQGSRGLSCLAAGGAYLGAGHALLAGTADGRLHLLDAARADAAGAGRWTEFRVAYEDSTATSEPGAAALSTVAVTPLGCAAVGTAGGRLALLDARSGRVEVAWSAHGGEVTSLVAAEGGHRLLSASADSTVKLWDLRRAAPPASRAPPTSTLVPMLSPTMLHQWRCASPPAGLHTLGSQALCYAGVQVGVLQLQAPFGGGFRAVRRRAAVKGQPRESAISGIALLPNSQLLLVGTEDGQIRICV